MSPQRVSVNVVLLIVLASFASYLVLVEHDAFVVGIRSKEIIIGSANESMIENDNESMIGTNSDYEDNGNENGPSADEKEEEDNIEENEKDADQLHEIQSGKVNPLTLDQIMDFNCHEPIGVIQGNQDTKSELPSKVINLGFAKQGSTSIQLLFSSSGRALKNQYQHASHWMCGKELCGVCMNEALKENRPLLSSCGDFKVYSQLDCEGELSTGDNCFFPQLTSLNEIYDEVPDAVFLLPFRNLKNWYHSLKKWHETRKRLTEVCDLPGLPLGKGGDDDDLERWVCGHVQNVRKFVFDHPSTTLIEFQMEDEDVGEYLASILPGLDPKFWKKSNVNPSKKSDRRKLQRYSQFV